MANEGKMTKAPFWEASYADIESATFKEGKPSQEIRDAADALKPGAQILDLGCGDGRNALYLAGRGFDVTGVDISDHGIRKLNAHAARRGLNIRSHVADMCDYAFPHPYDLIVSHGCLHLVDRSRWEQLITRMKQFTVSGGLNVIAVFTDTIAPPDDLKDFCIGLFREGEIFALYADWELELKESYVLEDEHPGSPPHTHPINKLVARKPP